MNITTISAQIYSMNKGIEIVYEQTQVGGNLQGEFKTRAVESIGSYIRTECLVNGVWQAGKSYVVKSNKQRNAERIKASVNAFLHN